MVLRIVCIVFAYAVKANDFTVLVTALLLYGIDILYFMESAGDSGRV